MPNGFAPLVRGEPPCKCRFPATRQRLPQRSANLDVGHGGVPAGDGCGLQDGGAPFLGGLPFDPLLDAAETDERIVVRLRHRHRQPLYDRMGDLAGPPSPVQVGESERCVPPPVELAVSQLLERSSYRSLELVRPGTVEHARCERLDLTLVRPDEQRVSELDEGLVPHPNAEVEIEVERHRQAPGRQVVFEDTSHASREAENVSHVCGSFVPAL